MFHLSLPCENLEATRNFYLDIPGVKIGREQPNWIDIDLDGNQLTFVSIPANLTYPNYRFEETSIPSFHFGVILDDKDWNKLRTGLEKKMDVEVKTFLAGQKGEHSSFFLIDPNGYTIEFKCFSWEGEEFET